MAASEVPEVLASFRAQARGIKLYDVPLSNVREGLIVYCELEPLNTRDANGVACDVTLRAP